MLCVRLPSALSLLIAATFAIGCGTEPAPSRNEHVASVRSAASAPELVDWIARATEPTALRPPARYWHSLAFDPVRKVTVLFGGRTNDIGSMLDDTWEWNGQVWTEKKPKTHPKGRHSFGMAYSALHGGVILYGGLSRNSAGDPADSAETWKWDGQNWSLLPVSGAPPLEAHALIYDSNRKVVLAFGGLSNSEPNLNVWELDAQHWTKPPSPNAPTYRSLQYFVMTYHPERAYGLVFGGAIQMFEAEPVEISGGTWTWDGATWTQLPFADSPDAGSSSSPPPLAEMAGTYDSKRHRTVLFSGGTFEVFSSGNVEYLSQPDTWEFDGEAWARRITRKQPLPRVGAAMAYDGARDRAVLFGGFAQESSEVDETWEYSHTGSPCTTNAECGDFFCVDGVCCNAPSCGTCQACSPVSGRCEARLSQDDPDSCTGDDTCNAAGECRTKNGITCQKDVDCASGHCQDGVCCNTECSGTCQSCTLLDSRGVCSFTSEPAHGQCPGDGGVCGARCTGADRECVFPSGTDCGSTCKDSLITHRTCNESGACVSAPETACVAHFACRDSTACLASCVNDGDCTLGYSCQSGACRDRNAHCVDDHTAEDSAGNRDDCGHYACVEGACKHQCTSGKDCSGNYICAKGSCVVQVAAENDSSGCGCRTARQDGSARAQWALGMALALGFAGSRRLCRRARSAARQGAP